MERAFTMASILWPYGSVGYGNVCLDNDRDRFDGHYFTQFLGR